MSKQLVEKKEKRGADQTTQQARSPHRGWLNEGGGRRPHNREGIETIHKSIKINKTVSENAGRRRRNRLAIHKACSWATTKRVGKRVGQSQGSGSGGDDVEGGMVRLQLARQAASRGNAGRTQTRHDAAQ